MYNTELPTRAELPSSRQLIRSTVIAVAVAGALLVTVVLPAEYGIDPTGVGQAIGLVEMGRIKTSLATESDSAPGTGAPESSSGATPVASKPVVVPEAPPTVNAAAQAPAVAAGKRDEMRVVLKPGQAAEIKLDMQKGDTVAFQWDAQGGGVNFDTHGDPLQAKAGFYHGYGKGRGARQDKGQLEAAFDGSHGWYWRNRSKSEVTVVLKVNGEYAAIKRVL